MKKILFLTLAAVALVFSASCERKGVIYDIPEGCQAVSFTTDVAVFSMVAEDGNKITVSLNRGNTKGAASVPFTFADGTDGVFTPAKSSFDFADGEAVAFVDITYPDINDFGGEVFEMVLTVDEAQVSPAGIGELTVTAQRKLTLQSQGVGVWFSEFFGEKWEQEILNAQEATNYYVLPDCWVKGVSFSFSYKNGQVVFPESFETGYKYSGYMVYMEVKEVTVADGKMTVVTDYTLPTYKAGFVLYSSYEEFTLPNGFSF